MKKAKIIIFFTLVISISLFIGSFLGYNLTKDNKVNIIVPEKSNPTIITVEATECNTKNYIELTDYNIYTYCLDHLMIFTNNNLIELKNYVPDKPEFITELISNLELETELNDGGTKIYKDKNDYTNAGLTLIKCNTLDSNKDIYIGPKDMEYQESFCKNIDNSLKTFTKTYEVLNVALSNSDEFIYLTLRQFQFEEIETIKVKKSLNYDITVGKNYEFTLEYTTEDIEDNIKSIFNNATLTSIVETDKTGLDQVQDPIN
mgnify:CR=1 FL=1